MWSEELQNRTREAIQEPDVRYIMADGNVPLKKWSTRKGVFGLIHFSDFMDEKFIVKNRENAELVWEYGSLDEMIEDGWAVD